MPVDKILESPEESKKKNVDNLPYKVTDVRYPIPLEEGETIPEFSLDTAIASRGRTRESRQVHVPVSCKLRFKVEHLNKGHCRTGKFVLCREVVPFWRISSVE